LFLHAAGQSEIQSRRDSRGRTLLYLRISRTRLLKASSTLIRCLAEVSMNLHPKCLARSRPSVTSRSENHCSRVVSALHTVHANLALVLEIAFVSHNNNRERVLVLDSQDLLVENADFLERVSRRDRVDEEETLASSHILLPHGPKKDWRQLSRRFPRGECGIEAQQ
jgi:hypothetical protein